MPVPRMTRHLAATLVLAVGVHIASCNDVAGPGRIGGVSLRLGAIPEMAQLGGGPIVIDQARATLFRGEAAVLDTLAPIPDGATQFPLRLTVDIGPGAEFLLRLQLLSGGISVFEGTQIVTAVREGSGGDPADVIVQLAPLGPTAQVASVRLDPRDSVVAQLDELTFRVSASSAQQTPVTGFLYYVRTENPQGPPNTPDAQAPIAPNGRFVGPLLRRQVRVIVRVPTVPALEDTTLVTVVAEPRSIVAQAGSGQSGLPGVTLPLTARVLAADGLGVAGVQVRFAQLAPAGLRAAAGDPAGDPTATIPLPDVTTNASGDATTSVVLATLAGPDNVQAFVQDVDTVSFPLTVTAGAPVTAVAIAGDAQAAAAGTDVATPPRVRVLDAFGNRVPGASVSWAVTAGGGTIAPTTPGVTDANGEAALTRWTLGATLGLNTVTATVGTLPPVVFTATALAGAPANISFVAGAGQSATVGTAVAVAPRVVVRDANLIPVPGVPVTFTATNAGSVAPVSPVATDANGEAVLASWTLGTAAGVNTLTADIGGGLTASVSANGVPDAPATFVIAAGNGQTGVAGTAVAVPPSAAVRDQYGNGVPGIVVTFAVTAGGGTIAPMTPGATNASGIAALTSWTLGATAGLNQVRATIAQLPTELLFDATATSAAAASLAIVAGNAQSAVVGTVVAIPPRVRAVDGFGNPVAGVAVTFTPSGTSTVQPPTPVTTDAAGEAAVTSWTLGTTTGTYTLEASAPSLTPVTFTGTATSTGPSTLTVAPVDQYLVRGDTAQPIVVTARDGGGAPLPGVVVTYTGPATDGAGGTTTFSGAQVTDANGQITITGWRPGADRDRYFLQIVGGGITTSGIASAYVTNPASTLLPRPDATSAFTTTAGAAFAVPLGVQAYDEGVFGWPVRGARLTMTLARPDASGNIETVVRALVTNDTGYAALPLGDCCALPGTVTISVAGDGVPPVQWTLDVVDGNPPGVTAAQVARVDVLSGNGQVALAGAPLPQGLTFAAFDPAGRRVTVSGGLEFRYVGPPGDTTVVGALTPNAAGIFTLPPWTLSAVPGLTSIVADFGGRRALVAAVTGAGAVALITSAIPSTVNTTVNAPPTQAVAFTVRAFDALGTAVPQAAVTWTAIAPAGVDIGVTSGLVTAGADGSASIPWPPLPAAGTYTLTAAVGTVTRTVTIVVSTP